MLLDCGTTRIKASAVDIETLHPEAAAEAAAPAPRRGSVGECETDPASLAATVAGVLQAVWKKTARAPTSIYLCTEMHGFLLADASGKALTAYIGWRDTRADRRVPGSESSILEQLEARVGSRFRAITGMRLRPGFPYANLACLRQEGTLPSRASLLAMPDWIAASLGVWRRRSHVTMAAGTGFLDLERRAWSEELLEAIGVRPGELALPELLDDEHTPIGEAEMRGHTVPIYAGAGDLQCAVLGAGVPHEAEACINVGTGSQVATLAPSASPDSAELRPFFGRRTLTALTHIPAGRMLEAFAAFFRDVAQSESGSARFWALLESLQVEEIRDAPLGVDPNIFAGSWRYSRGGSIGAIREGLFDSRALVASIAKGWIGQYAEAISALDPQRGWKTIALAGGLPRRLKWFAESLGRTAARPVVGPAPGEDPLNGLAALARS